MEIRILLEIIGLVALFLIFYYGIAFYTFDMVKIPEGKYKTIDLIKLDPNNEKDKKIMKKFDVIEELKFLYSQKELPNGDDIIFKKLNEISYKDLKKYKGFVNWFEFDKFKDISEYSGYIREHYYYTDNDTLVTSENTLNKATIYYLGILITPFLRKTYLPGYEFYTVLTAVLFSMFFILLIPVLFF